MKLLAGVLVSLVLVAACSGAPDARATRCEKVNADVAQCLGKGSPLFDCATVGDADLEAAETLATGPGCALVGEAPIDGDVASASCRLYGVDCVASIQKAPSGTGAAHPIVLVNGIDTSPLFRWSTRIEDVLRAQGNQVYLATLTPYQTPQKRAPVLQARIAEILAATGATQVNLVCHSLGGLDCRYYASPGGLAADLGLASDALSSKIASITTVGTAHRGTHVADVALGALAAGHGADTTNAIAAVFGDYFSPDRIATNPDVRASLAALTADAMLAFNAGVPDAPRVVYQSYAGFSRENGASTPAHDAAIRAACVPTRPADGTGLALFRAHDRLALPLFPLFTVAGNSDGDVDKAEPNDGLVTIPSAKWGTFRGCLPADHMEQLGQYLLPDVNVRTGVDIAWFYAAIASDLGAAGL